jgi:hypothetical protein
MNALTLILIGFAGTLALVTIVWGLVDYRAPQNRALAISLLGLIALGILLEVLVNSFGINISMAKTALTQNFFPFHRWINLIPALLVALLAFVALRNYWVARKGKVGGVVVVFDALFLVTPVILGAAMQGGTNLPWIDNNSTLKAIGFLTMALLGFPALIASVKLLRLIFTGKS